MKIYGGPKLGCQCRYCVGTGRSKSMKKKIKHGARQEAKEIVKDGLRHTDGEGKKGTR